MSSLVPRLKDTDLRDGSVYLENPPIHTESSYRLDLNVYLLSRKQFNNLGSIVSSNEIPQTFLILYYGRVLWKCQINPSIPYIRVLK